MRRTYIYYTHIFLQCSETLEWAMYVYMHVYNILHTYIIKKLGAREERNRSRCEIISYIRCPK